MNARSGMKAPEHRKVLHLHSIFSAHLCYLIEVSKAWKHAYLHHPWAQIVTHYTSTQAHSISDFAQHITTIAVMVYLWRFLCKAALPSLLRCTRLTHKRAIQRPVTLPPLVRTCSSIQLLWRWGRKPLEGEKVCLFSSTHAQRRGKMLLFPLSIGCEHIPSLSTQST